MGMKGAENISKYLESITAENIDINEALAAKEYFSYYHVGLNRRGDDPINSRLNYGYAVIRSSIARSLVAAGFIQPLEYIMIVSLTLLIWLMTL